MAFESPDVDLSELLDGVRTGKIQLPDFQRGWKWDTDRIAGLLASISLDFPVGVVMQLEAGGDSRFATRPLAGAEATANGVAPERLLLDGQQRLTSLFQALKSGQVVDTADARGKQLKRWYYLDIAMCLDPDGDREEAIVALPEDRVVREDFGRVTVLDVSTRERECAAELFPLSIVFDSDEAHDWSFAYLDHGPGDDATRKDRWKQFRREVLDKFTHYKVPVIVLPKSTPREAVCTVFEKVNTGGVQLNVFELLTATYASDSYRLNDDWNQRYDRLKRYKVLQGLQNTDFLQAITLLTTYDRRMRHASQPGVEAPGVSCKRKDILRLSLADYQAWADKVESSLVWAHRFLATERIFTADDVPYRTQLVPLAAIRTVLGDKADLHGNADKLRQWYWCGVLGELYGGTTETRFSRDIEQVVAWIDGDGPPPGTVESANFQAGRLLTLRTRNSAAYKGVYALLMRNGCVDWGYRQDLSESTFYDYAIDIHHIYPKAWCEKTGIDPARRESIVNKTALAAKTNRMIGARAPGDYAAILERNSDVTSEQLDDYFRSHELDPALLRANDFTAFFDDRRERLLALIEKAMGKPAGRAGTGWLPVVVAVAPPAPPADAASRGAAAG